MLSASNLVDYVIIVSGLAVCVKKVVEMERFHSLRVIALASILSFIVILYFLMYCFTLGNVIYWNCFDNQF